MLTAISPIDGRYERQTKSLSEYFSEYALIKYRVFVEIQYFIALCNFDLPQLKSFEEEKLDALNQIFENFTEEDAALIKNIEKTTNHDVKAVEYFLKEQFEALRIEDYKEFIHFGLTSQDINNTAIPLSIKNAMLEAYTPVFTQILEEIRDLGNDWLHIPMLARTHGQPASPTLLGKELLVFVERLENEWAQTQRITQDLKAKFGGATGNFNAHVVAYPTMDWEYFGNQFVGEYLGLVRHQYTTQIAHYDDLAALFHSLCRINTILIDFARDIWTYISMEYFKQKTIAGEVGSSAMPHKVNPIDFENAEGNFGMANAIFTHLAEKLPVSRLQRDLTDSTVLRNVGVPFGHTLIGFKSILKGLSKLLLNEQQLDKDLENNWMVTAEAIQTILRREGYEQPYEALKALTRGKNIVQKEDMHRFIDALNVSETIKNELKDITPQNYTGVKR
jgi:adenylosuccinate lyase